MLNLTAKQIKLKVKCFLNIDTLFWLIFYNVTTNFKRIRII
jgi:hypothetical protein